MYCQTVSWINILFCVKVNNILLVTKFAFPEPLTPPPVRFSSIPSVVGVWIFSGITQLTLATSSLLSDFCHENEKNDKTQTKIAN